MLAEFCKQDLIGFMILNGINDVIQFVNANLNFGAIYYNFSPLILLGFRPSYRSRVVAFRTSGSGSFAIFFRTRLGVS